MSSILLLGGTAEAKQQAVKIAALLRPTQYRLIYSLAGLVRTPKQLPCEVITGGFSQYGGLANYVRQENIHAIIDMTHPYAETMSFTAWQVSLQLGLHYWQYQRPEWQSQATDNWQLFDKRSLLFEQLADKRSVFLAIGQLLKDELQPLSQYRKQGQKQYLRTAKAPAYPIPGIELLLHIGPFEVEQERLLLRELQIDALVCKNSGGSASYAKIIAARELSLPVFMLARPSQSSIAIYDDLNHLMNSIQKVLAY